MPIFKALVAQLGVRPGAAVRVLFRRGHGGLVGVEEGPEAMFGFVLNYFRAEVSVTSRGSSYLAIGRGTRGPVRRMADTPAGFVLLVTDRS